MICLIISPDCECCRLIGQALPINSFHCIAHTFELLDDVKHWNKKVLLSIVVLSSDLEAYTGFIPHLRPVGWHRKVIILRLSPSCNHSWSMMRIICRVSISWRRSSPACQHNHLFNDSVINQSINKSIIQSINQSTSAFIHQITNQRLISSRNRFLDHWNNYQSIVVSNKLTINCSYQLKINERLKQPVPWTWSRHCRPAPLYSWAPTSEGKWRMWRTSKTTTEHHHHHHHHHRRHHHHHRYQSYHCNYHCHLMHCLRALVSSPTSQLRGSQMTLCNVM